MNLSEYLLHQGWRRDRSYAELKDYAECYWLPFGYITSQEERVVVMASRCVLTHPSTGRVIDTWQLETWSELGDASYAITIYNFSAEQLLGQLTTRLSHLAQLLSALHGEDWVHP